MTDFTFLNDILKNANKVEQVEYEALTDSKPYSRSQIYDNVVAEIHVEIKTKNRPRVHLDVGYLIGIRRKKGWGEYYVEDSDDSPYLGFESDLSYVSLATPIFSQALNPYLAFYQSEKEAKEKLRNSIRDTLNGLLANGDREWLKKAVAIKKKQMKSIDEAFQRDAYRRLDDRYDEYWE